MTSYEKTRYIDPNILVPSKQNYSNPNKIVNLTYILSGVLKYERTKDKHFAKGIVESKILCVFFGSQISSQTYKISFRSLFKCYLSLIFSCNDNFETQENINMNVNLQSDKACLPE